MVASDANAISAVLTRDVLPRLSARLRELDEKRELALGRVLTASFVTLSVLIALNADRLGGVLGIILAWVGALIGPISIPLMLGMLRPFHRIGPSAAIASWAAGLCTFGLVKYGLGAPEAVTVVSPVLVSFVVFVLVGVVRRDAPAAAREIVDTLAGRPMQGSGTAGAEMMTGSQPRKRL